MDGVSAVSSQPKLTVASEAVQNSVNARINGFPERIVGDQHVAHAFVPVGVAALLREYPTLLPAAVNAFTARDASDNKALRMMRHFPPEQRVMTAVRFSRALFAKMQSRPYCPDARIGWNIPPPSHQHHKQHLLGVKLACGFELLVSHAGGLTPTPSDEAAPSPSASLKDNPRWIKYQETLSERGYFRGSLKGSKLYQELEANAAQYFTQHVEKSKDKTEGKMDALSSGALIVKLLPTVNADLDFFKERQDRLVPQDDESWLTLTPELLDDMLESRYGRNTSQLSTDQMQAGLQTLLENPSQFEGVEVGPELQDKLRKLSTMSLPRRKKSENLRKKSHARKPSTIADPLRKISSQSCASNASEMSSFSDKINFNADAFMDSLKNMLEVEVPEDEYWDDSDSSSGLSSYGDDDEDRQKRKVSNGSQESSASSEGDVDLRSAMKAMEDELRKTTLAESLSTKDAEASSSDEDVGEFDDCEYFAPVKVDAECVQKLVQAYKMERNGPGPASTLLGTIGMKPN